MSHHNEAQSKKKEHTHRGNTDHDDDDSVTPIITPTLSSSQSENRKDAFIVGSKKKSPLQYVHSPQQYDDYVVSDILGDDLIEEDVRGEESSVSTGPRAVTGEAGVSSISSSTDTITSSVLPPTPSFPFSRNTSSTNNNNTFSNAGGNSGVTTTHHHHLRHHLEDIPDDHSFVLQDVEKGTSHNRLRVGGAPGLRGSVLRKQPPVSAISSRSQGGVQSLSTSQLLSERSPTSNSLFLPISGGGSGVTSPPGGAVPSFPSSTSYHSPGSLNGVGSSSMLSSNGRSPNDPSGATCAPVSRDASTLGSATSTQWADPSNSTSGQFFQRPQPGSVRPVNSIGSNIGQHHPSHISVSRQHSSSFTSPESMFHPLQQASRNSQRSNNNNNVLGLSGSRIGSMSSVAGSGVGQCTHHMDSPRGTSAFSRGDGSALDGVTRGGILNPRSAHRQSRMSSIVSASTPASPLFGGMTSPSQLGTHFSSDAAPLQSEDITNQHGSNSTPPPTTDSNNETITDSEAYSSMSDDDDVDAAKRSSVMGIMERLLFDLKSVTFDQRIDWSSAETFLQCPFTMKFLDNRVENEYCRGHIEHKSHMLTIFSFVLFGSAFLPLLDNRFFTDDALRPLNLNRAVKFIMCLTATILACWATYRIRKLKEFIDGARTRTVRAQQQQQQQPRHNSSTTEPVKPGRHNPLKGQSVVVREDNAIGDGLDEEDRSKLPDAITTTSLPMFTFEEKDYIRREKLGIHQVQVVAAVLLWLPTSVFAHYSVHIDRVNCMQDTTSTFIIQPNDKKLVCEGSISGIAVVASYIPVGLARPTFPFVVLIAILSVVGYIVGYFLLPYDMGVDNPYLDSVDKRMAAEAGVINLLCLITSVSIIGALEYSSRRRFQTHAQTLARLQLYMHQRAQLVTFVDSLVSPIIRQRLFDNNGGVGSSGGARQLAAGHPNSSGDQVPTSPRTGVHQFQGEGGVTTVDTNPCCTVVIADVANVNSLFLRGENSVGPMLKFGQLIAVMCDLWGMERICFVGDLVCVSCNVLSPCDDHSLKSIRFGLALQSEVQKKKLAMKLRVGVHSGRVVGAVVGTTTLQYALFGEAVQCAQAILTCATGGDVLATEITIKMCAGLVSTMPSTRTVEITTNRASGVPVIKKFNIFNVLGFVDPVTAATAATPRGKLNTKQGFHGVYGDLVLCDDETDLPLVQLHDIGGSLRSMSLSLLETPKTAAIATLGGGLHHQQQHRSNGNHHDDDHEMRSALSSDSSVGNGVSGGSFRDWDLSPQPLVPVVSANNHRTNNNNNNNPTAFNELSSSSDSSGDEEMRIVSSSSRRRRGDGGEDMANSPRNNTQAISESGTHRLAPSGCALDLALSPVRSDSPADAAQRHFSCSSFSKDVNELLNTAEALNEEDEMGDNGGIELGYSHRQHHSSSGLFLHATSAGGAPESIRSQVLSINSGSAINIAAIRINGKEGPSAASPTLQQPPHSNNEGDAHYQKGGPGHNEARCRLCDEATRQQRRHQYSGRKGSSQFNVAELIGSASEDENRRSLLKLYRALRTVTHCNTFQTFKNNRAEGEFQRVATYWNLFIFSMFLINISVSSVVLFIVAVVDDGRSSTGKYIFIPVVILCTISATFNIQVIRGKAEWRTDGVASVILQGCMFIKCALFLAACDLSSPAPSGNSLFFAFCMVAQGIPFYPNPSRFKWLVLLIVIMVVLPFQLFVGVTDLQVVDVGLWIVAIVFLLATAEIRERAMRSMCIEEHLKTAVTYMCREEELRRQAVLNSVIPPPLQRQLLLNTDVNGVKKDAAGGARGNSDDFISMPSPHVNFFNREGVYPTTPISVSHIPQPTISANFVHHQHVIVMCIRLDHILSELHYQQSAEVLGKALKVVERALREANRCFHMLIGDPRYPEWRAPDEDAPLSIAKLFGDRLYIIGPLVEVGYPGQFFREVALSALRALQVLSAYSQLTTQKKVPLKKSQNNSSKLPQSFPQSQSGRGNHPDDADGSLMNGVGMHKGGGIRGGSTQRGEEDSRSIKTAKKDAVTTHNGGGFRFTASIASGSMISTLTRTQFPTYEMFGSPLYAVRGLLDAIPVLPPSLNPTETAGWRADGSTPSIHSSNRRNGASTAWMSTREEPSMIVVEESVVKACISLLSMLRSVGRQMSHASTPGGYSTDGGSMASVSTVAEAYGHDIVVERPPDSLTRARYAMLSSVKRATKFGSTDTWRIKCFGKLDVRMVTFNYSETLKSRRPHRRNQPSPSPRDHDRSSSAGVSNPLTSSPVVKGEKRRTHPSQNLQSAGSLNSDGSLAETVLIATSGSPSLGGSRPSTVISAWMESPTTANNSAFPTITANNQQQLRVPVSSSNAKPSTLTNKNQPPHRKRSPTLGKPHQHHRQERQHHDNDDEIGLATVSGTTTGHGPLFFDQASHGPATSLPAPHTKGHPTSTLARPLNQGQTAEYTKNSNHNNNVDGGPFMMHALRPRDDMNNLVPVSGQNRKQQDRNTNNTTRPTTHEEDAANSHVMMNSSLKHAAPFFAMPGSSGFYPSPVRGGGGVPLLPSSTVGQPIVTSTNPLRTDQSPSMKINVSTTRHIGNTANAVSSQKATKNSMADLQEQQESSSGTANVRFSKNSRFAGLF